MLKPQPQPSGCLLLVLQVYDVGPSPISPGGVRRIQTSTVQSLQVRMGLLERWSTSCATGPFRHAVQQQHACPCTLTLYLMNIEHTPWLPQSTDGS